MYSIAFLTQQTDFVQSFKAALAYRTAEDLKFLFFTEEDQLRTHMAQYGRPDLLILDRHSKTTEWAEISNVKWLILAGQPSAEADQIDLYQSTDGFIQAIRRQLGQATPCKENDSHQKPAAGSKTIWLCDPHEGEWSKRFFAELVSNCYGQNRITLAADFSAFGNAFMTIPASEISNLSEHMIAFSGLGELRNSSSGDKMESAGLCLQENRFHLMEAVQHPFDLMTDFGGFFEKHFLKLAMPYELRLIYTGLPGECLLKQLARHANQTYLIDEHNFGSSARLRQMADWLRQVNPKLGTELIETANFEGRIGPAVVQVNHWINQR